MASSWRAVRLISNSTRELEFDDEAAGPAVRGRRGAAMRGFVVVTMILTSFVKLERDCAVKNVGIAAKLSRSTVLSALEGTRPLHMVFGTALPRVGQDEAERLMSQDG